MLLVEEKLCIKGSWDDTPTPPGRVDVKIVPSFAFGTGYHPSTRAFLDALEGIDLAGRTIFDIGCGNGVLSIAAVRLGARRAYATDVNRAAREAATVNVAANGLAPHIKVDRGTTPSVGSPDVILCNIDDLPVIQTVLELAARATPEAVLVCPPDDDAGAIVDKAAGAGLTLLSSAAILGGWKLLHFVRG